MMARTLSLALRVALVAGIAVVGCGGGSTPPVKPCDGVCQDNVGARSLREMMKYSFNKTLQGMDVGPQDATFPCPLGSGAQSVHIFGTATSNAIQGTTTVSLTYVFDHCGFSQTDTDPTQTYKMTLTGTVRETGILAVAAGSTTAIDVHSDSMTFSGTVYDPPIDYQQMTCPVALGQNGNQLGGTLCGRDVGLTL